MFKRILIATGLIAATLSFQAPAHANNGVVVKFGGGHNNQGFHRGTKTRKQVHKPQHRISQQRRGLHQPTHKPRVVHKSRAQKGLILHTPKRHITKRHYRLSNKQLRRHLRAKGLYNIRFVDRHHGVAKVVANNHRGYIGKYRVNTRNGHILSARVIRHKKRYR